MTKVKTEGKVDFLIAGTQKAGTSALFRYMKRHPDIVMSVDKEVHFFDDEERFSGAIDYSYYHKNFDGTMDGRFLVGEATPIYMYWKNAPRRIRQYNKDMKLIIVLRNPIDRAFSHWNMESGRGADSLCFSDAIRCEPARCESAHPLQHRVYSYLSRGRYSEQLRRIWKYFPRKQTLILRHEYLKSDPSAGLARVSKFLGIDAFLDTRYENVYSTAYRSQISESDRAYLSNYFYAEIKELESLLGWSCDSWLR